MYAMAGMFSSFNDPYNHDDCFVEKNTSQEDIKKRIDTKSAEIRKKRGIKTFTIEGVEIEARNLKNAKRKYNNLKLRSN